MARLGLGAFLEASGTELRPAEARRWRRAGVALAAVVVAQLELLALALAWDTPHRVTVAVALLALAVAAALGAGWMHYQYARTRRVFEQARTLAAEPAPTEAAEAGPPLDPQQAWLLLPVATLALLNPAATLRLALGALAAWRSLQRAKDSTPIA